MKYKTDWIWTEFEVNQVWDSISFTKIDWTFTKWEKTIYKDIITDSIFLKDLNKRYNLNLNLNK